MNRAALLAALGLVLIDSAHADGEASLSDLERARAECYQREKWHPRPVVRGCPVDWDDVESVKRLVARPVLRPMPPPPPLPMLPDEESDRLFAVLAMEYLISEAGEVVGVCVLKSVSPTVDAYFVDRARSSTFEPARACGEAIPYAISVTVHHHAWEWPRKPK